MVLLVGIVLLEMIESSGHAGNAEEEEKEVHVVSWGFAAATTADRVL